MTTILTDANFEELVLKSDKLTVIDFWATWCPPCVAIGPIIDSLAEDFDGMVNVGKLNADENPNISVAYGVTTLPCILYIYDGKVVDKQIGAARKSVYAEKIRQILDRHA